MIEGVSVVVLSFLSFLSQLELTNCCGRINWSGQALSAFYAAVRKALVVVIILRILGILAAIGVWGWWLWTRWA